MSAFVKLAMFKVRIPVEDTTEIQLWLETSEKEWSSAEFGSFATIAQFSLFGI